VTESPRSRQSNGRSEEEIMRPPFAFPVPPPRGLFPSAPFALSALFALSAPFALSACSVEAQVGERPRGTTPEGVPKLDVLFVIDDSGSMGQEQASLAANFPVFMDALAELPTGLPDLHVGVVSSDLGLSSTSGAGAATIAGCLGEGDEGALHAGSSPACAASTLTDNFLASNVTELGRVNNFTGELSDAFSCIATLGTGGCGFEQHLRSMRRALEPNPANDGFLRPDAFLAVVVIADEDDCSAATDEVFDLEATDPVPISSFRCTYHGVTCGGAPPSAPGTFDDCQPRGAGALHHPQEFVDFLNGLKSDPTKIMVSVVGGNIEPFQVEPDLTGALSLAPSCSTGLGDAVPATRLSWFAQQFGERGSFHTICADDLTPAIAAIGSTVRSRIEEWNPPDHDPMYASGCAVGGAGSRGAGAGLAFALCALCALSALCARSPLRVIRRRAASPRP
jgi:hypothetical protein